ncbi:SLC13 family permease [Frondihabitans australicus]|uniref:Arsenite efflux membrane protein ArsB n=1 Tax=Frondihabitans australicus TaxID=386892 RepID=A0A495IEN9_9MICO|nr:SLC13 family permease [Frondihabitans australicus]RKR73615.1 arsenite efflux membrane protein ArsB [Frondihabitans australicus]
MKTAILGGVLFALGIVAALTGIISGPDLSALVGRVAPILGFVVGLTIVADLAAEAGLFSWLAGAAARFSWGRVWVLWLFVVVLATVCTVFLSLDTTAVLLTPVVVLVARRVGASPLPFAFTTVWLANCGSMLLPVSNLTNLLAQHTLGSPAPLTFAAIVGPAAVVGIVLPLVAVAVRYRRELAARFDAAPVEPAADRGLFVAAGVIVLLLVPALVSGVAVWIPAAAAAVLLVVAFAVRRPGALRLGLVPWGTLLFASGLFLVVEAAHSLGLARLLGTVVGTGDSFGALVRLAGGAALSANLVNNLPAYLALEPVGGSTLRLVAILIGVNIGCIVTPWASLATLLWHGRLTGLGVEVPWKRFMIAGLGLAVVALPLSVLALLYL